MLALASGLPRAIHSYPCDALLPHLRIGGGKDEQPKKLLMGLRR